MADRRVQWDDRQLARRIERTPNRIDASMTAIIERHRVLGEAWMKSHARWHDNTGNARQGLHADTERVKHEFYMIILAHTVSYGIWLEIAHNGKYEIIDPAMRNRGDEVMKSVAGMFGRLFGGPER